MQKIAGCQNDSSCYVLGGWKTASDSRPSGGVDLIWQRFSQEYAHPPIKSLVFCPRAIKPQKFGHKFWCFSAANRWKAVHGIEESVPTVLVGRKHTPWDSARRSGRKLTSSPLDSRILCTPLRPPVPNLGTHFKRKSHRVGTLTATICPERSDNKN